MALQWHFNDILIALQWRFQGRRHGRVGCPGMACPHVFVGLVTLGAPATSLCAWKPSGRHAIPRMFPWYIYIYIHVLLDFVGGVGTIWNHLGNNLGNHLVPILFAIAIVGFDVVFMLFSFLSIINSPFYGGLDVATGDVRLGKFSGALQAPWETGEICPWKRQTDYRIQIYSEVESLGITRSASSCLA